MIYNLTLVHLLLALGASGCVYFALREIRRRYVSIWRLFVPATLATLVASGMFLLQVVAHRPPWVFEAALLAGLSIGAVRGFMTMLRVDLYMSMLQERSAAKRALLWIPIVLAIAVAAEIVGAVMTPALENLQLGAALLAMSCASMLVGRAIVLSARLAASLMAPASGSRGRTEAEQSSSR
jgi:hypothetical protein